jgi:hypothetical protein
LEPRERRTDRSRRCGGAPKRGPACLAGAEWLPGEFGAVSPVAVERESVDHERVAEKVEELAGVADAVGASDPEGARSCRTCAAALRTSGPKPGQAVASRQHSPNSPRSSEQVASRSSALRAQFRPNATQPRRDTPGACSRRGWLVPRRTCFGVRRGPEQLTLRTPSATARFLACRSSITVVAGSRTESQAMRQVPRPIAIEHATRKERSQRGTLGNAKTGGRR